MSNNELTHHGVMGMKWGVRRTDAQLARARGSSGKSSSAAPKKKIVGDGEKTNYKPKLKAEELSDKELKARIQRIENEKKYNQLTAKQKSGTRKFVEDVLVNAAKGALTTYANKKMTQLLSSAFDGTSSGGSSSSGTGSSSKSSGGTGNSGKGKSGGAFSSSLTSGNSGPKIDFDKFFGN